VTKKTSPPSTKPKTADDMTSDEWFRQLATDALNAVIELTKSGHTEFAKNAAADLYLACKDHIKGEESGVWAYLYDWASNETAALIYAAENETSA
jgi:hypothetical protein